MYECGRSENIMTCIAIAPSVDVAFLNY